MNSNPGKIVALALFLIVLAAGLYTYRPVHERYARITVVGDAQTKVEPDTAVITFSVVTQGKRAVEAQQENAKKSDAVKMAVEAITTGTKTEIKTSSYDLSPEQDYYSGKMPKILGYEVKNTVTVTIARLDNIGQIVDSATSAGANSVSGIQFIVGEESPMQGDGLASATRKAMAKAEGVAKALNGRIVRIVQTIEGGVPPNLASGEFEKNAYTMSNTMVDRKPSIATPLQAGSVNINSQVTLIVDVETGNW